VTWSPYKLWRSTPYLTYDLLVQNTNFKILYKKYKTSSDPKGLDAEPKGFDADPKGLDADPKGLDADPDRLTRIRIPVFSFFLSPNKV
jgi:hypothetical protein